MGKLAAAFGDVGTDVGQIMFAGGAIGGAVLGAETGGPLGAVAGAASGSTPGLVVMGVSGTLSATGNAIMDATGRNYVEGTFRFAINYGGGRLLHRAAQGGGIGKYLSQSTRNYLAGVYDQIATATFGRAFSADSPVDCEGIKR